ncbi:MAG: glycosyltransferase [Streptococcaceae bacterium]|jgi:UDP-D-galactose:(glucosyl)LPS alpha-1,6-D-galactosyltransferase|nr:glycosyltransferase [Streptococcaceae bacterium]
MKIDVMTGHIGGRGGVQVVIDAWWENLSEEYDLRFLAPAGLSEDSWTEKYPNREVKSYTHLPRPIRMLATVWSLYRYMATTNSDLVIVENFKMVPQLMFWKKVLQKEIKVVSWMHQTLHLENMAPRLKNADAHLAIASGIKEQLLEVGVPEESIYLIYNPMKETSQIIPRTSNGVKRFIYVGRGMLHGQKNMSELFDALALLQSPDWVLELYGVSAEENPELLSYLESKGIEKHVVFKGWVSSPFDNMGSADVLVLTSKFEGFGLVLLEAIQRGVPVISSDIKVGPRDFVQEKVNGYLYEPGNIKELAGKLSSILDGEHDFPVEDMKKSVEKFAEDRYFIKVKNTLEAIVKGK